MFERGIKTLHETVRKWATWREERFIEVKLRKEREKIRELVYPLSINNY